MRDSSKRAALLQWLYAVPSVDVVCLQEVHCVLESECQFWFRSSGVSSCVSPGSNRSCGCIVLCRPSLSLVTSWSDSEGRLLQCEFLLRGVRFQVISLYAPNRNPQRNDFLDSVQTYVDPSVPTILAGDLNSVFDRAVDHRGSCVDKLSYFGADQATIKWFQSYPSDRNQTCNVNGSLSTTSTVTCGVPQGSILGPLLFLMYINDLPNCLRDAAPRMFANDTNITLSAKTVADLKLAVTSELNNLTSWLRANRLSLNVAKTELMIIGSRQRLHSQSDEIDICIDDKMIKRVDHTKSLGLTIDAQLSWSKHVDEICKKASSATGALKRVRPFISKDFAVEI